MWATLAEGLADCFAQAAQWLHQSYHQHRNHHQEHLLRQQGCPQQEGGPSWLLQPEDLNTDGIDPNGVRFHVYNVSVYNDDDSIAVKPSSGGDVLPLEELQSQG